MAKQAINVARSANRKCGRVSLYILEHGPRLPECQNNHIHILILGDGTDFTIPLVPAALHLSRVTGTGISVHI